MRVRRKPMFAEARLFDPENDREEAAGAVAWCGGIWTDQGCLVQTLEGPLTARPGDWIVQGSADEFWPVRADIFPGLYEEARAEKA